MYLVSGVGFDLDKFLVAVSHGEVFSFGGLPQPLVVVPSTPFGAVGFYSSEQESREAKIGSVQS